MDQPLFNDSDILSKLCSIYRLSPVISSVGPDMLILDSTVSYILVCDCCCVLIIRQKSNWRLIIRDTNRVKLDVVTKNDYRIVPKADSRAMTFYAEREKTAWIFEIVGQTMRTNPDFIHLDITATVHRMVAAIRC